MAKSNHQLREKQVYIRCSENIEKKFLAICEVHGMNQNDCFQLLVINSHKEHVRDGYINAKYDNAILDDLAVKAAARITAAVKGEKLDF